MNANLKATLRNEATAEAAVRAIRHELRVTRARHSLVEEVMGVVYGSIRNVSDTRRQEPVRMAEQGADIELLIGGIEVMLWDAKALEIPANVVAWFARRGI
jgi:hypothetical protein